MGRHGGKSAQVVATRGPRMTPSTIASQASADTLKSSQDTGLAQAARRTNPLGMVLTPMCLGNANTTGGRGHASRVPAREGTLDLRPPRSVRIPPPICRPNYPAVRIWELPMKQQLQIPLPLRGSVPRRKNQAGTVSPLRLHRTLNHGLDGVLTWNRACAGHIAMPPLVLRSNRIGPGSM